MRRAGATGAAAGGYHDGENTLVDELADTLREGLLPDGSELVLLHESDSMPGKRRRDIAARTAPRLPDTVARPVRFTVTTRTRSGRVKTSVIRVLTTLLDHAGFPTAEIADRYAERWQAEETSRPARD